MVKRPFVSIALLLSLAPAAHAEGFGALFEHYARAGGSNFSAERGRVLWSTDHGRPGGESLNCASCHGPDLRRAGKHNRSGKRIEPMAPSVNKNRYVDFEKTEKWFVRNCKQVLKRECTAQEKGDVIRYLSQF
jgi:hypothetical protein